MYTLWVVIVIFLVFHFVSKVVDRDVGVFSLALHRPTLAGVACNDLLIVLVGNSFQVVQHEFNPSFNCIRVGKGGLVMLSRSARMPPSDRALDPSFFGFRSRK